MDTIPTQAILDRGARYLSNLPDDHVRRITLAQLLVDIKAVRTIEAGINAFRLWAVPESRNHPLEVILGIANDKVRTRDNPLHE